MIFVAEIEELSLYVFSNEQEAVAHCEGLDVEAAIWLFWDDQGSPLEARFRKPNNRGFFVVSNGVYTLAPSSTQYHAPLQEVINEIKNFESLCPFDSKKGVLEYLSKKALRY